MKLTWKDNGDNRDFGRPGLLLCQTRSLQNTTLCKRRKGFFLQKEGPRDVQEEA